MTSKLWASASRRRLRGRAPSDSQRVPPRAVTGHRPWWPKFEVGRSLVVQAIAGLCAGLLSAAGACGELRTPTRREEAFTPDAIVVLGHRPPLDARGLEYETRARVDHGIALFRRDAAPRIVFAGGESTPGVVESDVMAAYAEQQGVPAAAILRERASRDTIENARFAIALLRRELDMTRRPRIVLVTSDYHIERAARLMRCAGAEVATEPVALALDARARRKRERTERWVRFYYWFIDECERAEAS